MKQKPRARALFLSSLLVGLTVMPAAVSADADSEKQLTSKGLKEQAGQYVLKGERDLAMGVAEVRKAKSKMDGVIRQFRTIESRIKRAKALIAHHEYERRNLSKELAETTSLSKHNQLIAKINVLGSEIKEAREYRKVNEEKMNQAYDQARQEYVEKVMEWITKGEKLAEHYETLGKDKEVTAAIAKINETSPRPVKLGPTSRFTSTMAFLSRYRDEILSEDIALRREGNVFWVEVILNGTSRQSMIVDSGASLISIPHDMASELDISPGDKHPTIRVQLADGKIVDAKLVTIPSVQVGKFKVENVDCAVLPASLVAAQPLLGGTFLNEFTYRINASEAKLSLTKIKSAEDRAREAKEKREKQGS